MLELSAMFLYAMGNCFQPSYSTCLASRKLTTSLLLYWPCWVWSTWVEANRCGFFIAVYCLKTWKSNAIYFGIFVLNGLTIEMVVHFIDIDAIVNHHCVHFLFIITLTGVLWAFSYDFLFWCIFRSYVPIAGFRPLVSLLSKLVWLPNRSIFNKHTWWRLFLKCLQYSVHWQLHISLFLYNCIKLLTY